MSSKRCPFCAEEIQSEAIKCRYCGEFLDERNPSFHNLKIIFFIVLLVVIPFYEPMIGLVVGCAWVVLAITWLFITRHKLVPFFLMLRRDKGQGFQLFVRVSMACWLVFLSAATINANGRRLELSNHVQKRIVEARGLARQDRYTEALAALELDRRYYVSDLSEEDEENLINLKASIEGQYNDEQVGKILTAAHMALEQSNFDEAISILARIEQYPSSTLTRQATKLRRDCRRAHDQKFLMRFLADLDDAEFANVQIGKTEDIGQLFDSSALNAIFLGSLAGRDTELLALREEELRDRKNIEEERLRKEELVKRRQREKTQVLFAKRIDNVRSGPSTNFDIVRETAEDEKLIYLSKEGKWYKLDVDSAVENWVHESVVQTKSNREYLERANSDDAQNLDEVFFHSQARAQVIMNVESINLLVGGGGKFRVKRNPVGQGCFVY